jgi:hypothetical protein
MEWPAGMVEKAAVSANVYRAFKAYISAGGGARWAQSNGEAWYIITWVKQARGDYG